MRRVFLITPFLFLGLICLGVTFTAWLSASAHYHPGQVLFPLQESTEELRANFITDPIDKANYALQLLDWRVLDLSALTHTPAEVAALQALDKALERAQKISLAIPAESKPVLMYRLKETLEQVANLLTRLSISPQKVPDFYLAVLTRVLTFHDLAAQINLGNLPEPLPDQVQIMLPLVMVSNGLPASNISEQAWIDPQAVVFPPGSPGAQHAFFPLTGRHSTLECASCHLEAGKFTGIDRLCSSCHASIVPTNHFTGECSTCHSTNAWKPANFNHSGQTNCQSCHTRPNGHYSGQCSACHSTNAWKPASFNHSGQTNCQSCHTRPNGHYSGQCSACHSTNAWRPASFNHSGQNDCQSCHIRPNNHASGQCSTCHSTSAWKPASFNHSGQTDCQSCHTRPNGHYSGQCSACHSTNAWKPTSFNHSGQTDCQSCHTRPNGHYSGQCSSCHSTSAWRPASFNHSGQTDCQSCHNRPNGHWSGKCSQCHNTSSWSGVQVSGHTFPIEHKNAGGVCSRCHPSNSPAYTCYNCHDRAKMESKHAEKNIFDIASRCADCHPNGKGD
ncbi:MAG: hypothetical protein JSV61_11820 [Anaerolineales bacterium]|nr:MAG: hypothetical protein JSV61_11820 [Anaerolineales bacterium]